MAGVHGQEDKCGFSLSGLIQFGEKSIKPETALGVTVAALNGVALARIPVCLPLDFRVSLVCFSAAQLGAGQADAVFFAVELVGSGLIDLVGKHRAGVAAELPGIVFHSGLQVATLIEVAPGGLLKIGVAIYHGQMQLLPEFRWVGPFSSLNWANMRLLQTNDPICADMGAVVVHFLLLLVHCRDHGQAIAQPVGKKMVEVGYQSLKFFQLSGGKGNIIQLFAYCLPALCLGPFLTFSQFQIGFARFLC